MRTEVRRGRKFIEYVDDSLPTGSYVQEISGADVSYRDETGKWKPISTKFLSAKSGDFAFAANKLNHKIEVGNGGERRWYPRRDVTDEYLTLGKPEYYNPKNDKWQHLNIIRSGMKRDADDDDTVELDTNQDLILLMHSRWNGLKVDYVINSDKAPTRFRFSVDIVGLEYKDDKLYGKDGELVGILTPTIARDANDKELSAFGTYDGEYLEFGMESTGDAAYPITIDPDFSGSTADGYIRGNNASYSTARSTSSGFGYTEAYIWVGQAFVVVSYYIYRSFLKFDTSNIPDNDTITQVNLKLTVYADNSGTDFDVQVVKQNWSAQDPLSNTNRETAYDNCLSGTADDNIWRNTDGISANSTYTSGNLNTSWINKKGNTYYSLRSSRDASATQPTGNERIQLYSANSSTASYRPVLVVVYSAGSQDYTLTCEAGSYALTGTTANLAVQRNYVLVCGAGSYALTGSIVDLTVQRNYVLACSAGAYTLTGSSASFVIQRNYSLACNAGTYSLTGTNADLTVTRHYTLVCGAGSYALTGTATTFEVKRNYVLACSAGSYSLTGTNADLTVTRHYTLSCEAGSYALTGTNASLTSARTLSVITGDIIVSGAGTTDANGTYTYAGDSYGKPYYENGSNSIVWVDFLGYKQWAISVDGASVYESTDDVATPDLVTTWTAVNTGIAPVPTVTVATTYTLTGSDVTLTYTQSTVDYNLVCASGSYSLTGTNANLVIQRNYALICEAGDYAMTGTSVTLDPTFHRVLACEAGLYTLTGTDITFGKTKVYTLVCSAGSYVLTGSNATLTERHNFTLVLEAGSYSLTGTDISFVLQRHFTFVIEAGSYTLTGANVGLTSARTMALASGSYALTGTDAGLFKGLVLPCASGSYALTGSDAALNANYVFALGVGDYILVGTNAGIFMLSPTPDCRVYTIDKEGRLYIVPAELRVHDIPYENRTLEVKC